MEVHILLSLSPPLFHFPSAGPIGSRLTRFGYISSQCLRFPRTLFHPSTCAFRTLSLPVSPSPPPSPAPSNPPLRTFLTIQLLRKSPPGYDRVILLIKQSNTGSHRLPTPCLILTGLPDRLINLAETSIVPRENERLVPVRPYASESLSDICPRRYIYLRQDSRRFAGAE